MATRSFDHSPVDLGYSDLVAVTEEHGRRYTTPEGKVYPSITTCLSPLADKAIAAWTKRVDGWNYVGYAKQFSERAAARGESVHLACEDYLNNSVPTFDSPWIEAGFESLRPTLDECVGTIYRQEAPLYSDHLGVAGRVDLVAQWMGTTSIIDFKTSGKFKERAWCEAYFMQEAFYAIAWEERTGIPVTQLVTIIATDESAHPIVYIEHRDAWAKALVKVINDYKENQKG